MIYKAAFRVDASIDMGTGHVMRCLTLAGALNAKGIGCVFITRRQSGDLRLLIEEKGFKVYLLPEHSKDHSSTMLDSSLTHSAWLGCSWELDASQTLAALADIKPNWLIVDHYGLDINWELAVNSDDLKLIVIDDLADRKHLCEMLVDQNLGRRKEDYNFLVPVDCLCLIGPEYALLRPEFEELRHYSLARRKNPDLKTLLVSMGGVDKDNTSETVLDILNLCELPKDCSINVIMGSHAPWLKTVKDKAKKMQYQTEILTNVTNMAQRMSDADLSIGAAGGTSWERCALGVPSFLMVLAENQRDNVVSLEKCGAAKYFDSTSFSSFLNNSPEVKLRQMAIIAGALCQGDGATRVVQALLAGSGISKVSLIPAKPSDCDYIYSLQIQPAVRKFFRNVDVPNYDKHCSWYHKRLLELDGIIFKVKFGGEAAGMVRIDKLGSISPELSIIISSEYEGKGLGTKAISLICDLLPDVCLKAVVHAKNIGSMKLFGRSGFTKVAEEEDFFVLENNRK